MNERTMDRKSVVQERVNVLKTKGYRGFRLAKRADKPEYSIEVGATDKTGIMLIAVGENLDEAYENLIERIDITLDGG